ncbi:MAG: hypothetical protein ACKO58_07145, partial [Cyanobium sp.]
MTRQVPNPLGVNPQSAPRARRDGIAAGSVGSDTRLAERVRRAWQGMVSLLLLLAALVVSLPVAA